MADVFRLRSLGSGSRGNATLVECRASHGATQRLLVDAGMSSLRKLEQRLAELAELPAEAIDALFITHEHSDHIGCAMKWVAKYGTPIFMSRGTYQAIGVPDLAGPLHLVRDGDTLELGSELQLEPFTVPHDAAEPLQLRLSDGEQSLGILTDLGHISSHVLEMLQPCSTLLLEFNHQIERLEANPKYPAFLKRRIAGPHGHLNNEQAIQLAQHLCQAGTLRQIVAAHLSRDNNHPDTVRTLLHGLTAQHGTHWHIADADLGSQWIDCHGHALV